MAPDVDAVVRKASARPGRLPSTVVPTAADPTAAWAGGVNAAADTSATSAATARRRRHGAMPGSGQAEATACGMGEPRGWIAVTPRRAWARGKRWYRQHARSREQGAYRSADGRARRAR